jgi:hypothetical protein
MRRALPADITLHRTLVEVTTLRERPIPPLLSQLD